MTITQEAYTNYCTENKLHRIHNMEDSEMEALIKRFPSILFVHINYEQYSYEGDIVIHYIHNRELYEFGSGHCSCDDWYDYVPEKLADFIEKSERVTELDNLDFIDEFVKKLLK